MDGEASDGGGADGGVAVGKRSFVELDVDGFAAEGGVGEEDHASVAFVGVVGIDGPQGGLSGRSGGEDGEDAVGEGLALVLGHIGGAGA